MWSEGAVVEPSFFDDFMCIAVAAERVLVHHAQHMLGKDRQSKIP